MNIVNFLNNDQNQESTKISKTETYSKLGLSAQGLRLERSTPAVTADLKTVFKQLLDLCEFNASIMNLLEPTGLPQMDQNSEFITCLTTFLLV